MIVEPEFDEVSPFLALFVKGIPPAGLIYKAAKGKLARYLTLSRKGRVGENKHLYLTNIGEEHAHYLDCRKLENEWLTGQH